MANDEDLARIRQGVAAWNDWRAQNRERPVDLGGADLRGVNLYRADLRGVNLYRAYLHHAELSRANLDEANFTGADLGEANFTGADLRRANLRRAILYETVFANVDLSAMQGLETCQHAGPSILDHRTLKRSDRLPLAFLRGCGLPDKLIDYLPLLLEEASTTHASSATRPGTRRSPSDCMPTCRTPACAAGLRRTTCRSARRHWTRSTPPFASATSCC